jgi:ribosomal protein L14
MKIKPNPIREGETVSFVVYQKRTGVRLRRAVGTVFKVNRVNMVIIEDREELQLRKIWTVYKNYVRRHKELA